MVTSQPPVVWILHAIALLALYPGNSAAPAGPHAPYNRSARWWTNPFEGERAFPTVQACVSRGAGTSMSHHDRGCRRVPRLEGGPGDCMQWWNLLGWRPTALSKDALSFWCTADRVSLLQSHGIECMQLTRKKDWVGANRTLTRRAGRAVAAEAMATFTLPEHGLTTTPLVLRTPTARRAFDFLWQLEALRIRLPRRNTSCPWVANIRQFWCGDAPSCGAWLDDVVFPRDDIVWANDDLGDHVIVNDDRGLRGVTLWPTCGVCAEMPRGWPLSPARPHRHRLTFQGACQPGWYNSSFARPKLRALFAGTSAAGVHFKCAGPGKPDPGFDPDAFIPSFDTDFMLIPHGDNRFNYRFSEAVAAGAIPVVIADGLTLPLAQRIPWADASVVIPEATLLAMQTGDELLALLPSGAKLQQMREALFRISAEFFHAAPAASRELALVQSVRAEVATRVGPANQPATGSPHNPEDRVVAAATVNNVTAGSNGRAPLAVGAQRTLPSRRDHRRVTNAERVDWTTRFSPRRKWEGDLAVPRQRCDRGTGECTAASSLNGTHGECFKLWELAAWNPWKSDKNQTLVTDAGLLDTWCTVERAALLRAVGMDCRSVSVAYLQQGKRRLSPHNFARAATVHLPSLSLAFHSLVRAFDFVWQREALMTRLPPRGPACPWLVNLRSFSCGNQTSCGGWFDRDLVGRADIVWVNVDAGDHVLTRDDAALNRSVTVWPPCRICRHMPPEWPHHPFASRKFRLTYQGNCQRGFYNSSEARPQLRRLFERGGPSRPGVHFKCVTPKTRRTDGAARTGTHHQRDFVTTLNSDFVLVPHGDGRWNYRFSEVVAAGAIPVVIADGLTLPFDGQIDWSTAAVRIPEAEIAAMVSLDALLDRLPSGAALQRMREAVFRISALHFHGVTARAVRELSLVHAVRAFVGLGSSIEHTRK